MYNTAHRHKQHTTPLYAVVIAAIFATTTNTAAAVAVAIL